VAGACGRTLPCKDIVRLILAYAGRQAEQGGSDCMGLTGFTGGRCVLGWSVWPWAAWTGGAEDGGEESPCVIGCFVAGWGCFWSICRAIWGGAGGARRGIIMEYRLLGTRCARWDEMCVNNIVTAPTILNVNFSKRRRHPSLAGLNCLTT